MDEKEQMYNYKVLLPTAGIGSRVSNKSNNLNKGLIGIDNKPVLSHIVEKFHPDVEFVVALGHGGNYVKQYLEIVYSERKFKFVEIDKYVGEGTGLGLTVNSCREYLQCPFVFVSNDTVFQEQLYFDEITYNWLGYSTIQAGSDYRSLVLDDDGNVIKLNDKVENSKDLSYIGICGIKDYNHFWNHMESDESLTMGESYGIDKMLQSKINFNSTKFTWYDTGNLKSLSQAKKELKSKHQPNILEKDNEAIWFANNKTIKFSTDRKFISDRVKRTKYLKNHVPNIIDSSDNFYTYDFIKGEVFSKKVTGKRFEYLLSWLDDFWKPIQLTKSEEKEFQHGCEEFYGSKTFERIDLYYEKFYNKDVDEIVNDNKLPPLLEVFKRLDMSWLTDGVPSIFHGDLHFENILVNKTNDGLPFSLLDWRQNFNGVHEYGDLYYDLAKLYHGLIISHDFINRNHYNYNRELNTVYYDFHRKNTNIECEKILQNYVEKQNLDWKKVKVITSLIFLNIAGLHHYPYCHLLYYLGRVMLTEETQ